MNPLWSYHVKGNIMTRQIKFRAWHKKQKVMTYDRPNAWVVGTLNLITTTWDIMQFTGLYDKNNNEIYENDIVQYTDIDYPELNSIGVVKYNPPEFGFDDDFTFWTPYEPNDYEIIGNVWENPELVP